MEANTPSFFDTTETKGKTAWAKLEKGSVKDLNNLEK